MTGRGAVLWSCTEDQGEGRSLCLCPSQLRQGAWDITSAIHTSPIILVPIMRLFEHVSNAMQMLVCDKSIRFTESLLAYEWQWTGLVGWGASVFRRLLVDSLGWALLLSKVQVCGSLFCSLALPDRCTCSC